MPKRTGLWAVELLGDVLVGSLVVSIIAPMVISINWAVDGTMFDIGFFFYLLGVLVAVGIAYSQPSPKPRPRQWLGWPWWAHQARHGLQSPP